LVFDGYSGGGTKMKAILVLVILGLGFYWQEQTAGPQSADILVVKFSCGRSDEPSRVIRSVQDPDPPMNEPFAITKTKPNEPQEVKNQRDLLQRGAELRGTEKDAERSREKRSTVYFYTIEIRNLSQKTMKSFAWQYQAGEAPDPNDRQFFCALSAKPNANKEFDLFSPLAPSRVVDARTADKRESQKERVVINEIEYADGSVWRRPSWNPKTFVPQDTQKVGVGKCIGL
jgi:hypothetical protein